MIDWEWIELPDGGEGLGGGRSGAVLLASFLGHEVALKKTALSDEKLLEREAKLLRELDSPSVVRCYGMTQDLANQTSYIVMEIMDGSLLDYFQTAGDLPLSFSLFVLLRKFCLVLVGFYLFFSRLSNSKE